MNGKTKNIMLSPRIQQRIEPTFQQHLHALSQESGGEVSDIDEHTEDINKCHREFLDQESDHMLSGLESDSVKSIQSLNSCDADADEFEPFLQISNQNSLQPSHQREEDRFAQKLNEIMLKFGFLNKEVVIEEEDPSKIQLTTQMSTGQENKPDKLLKKPAKQQRQIGRNPLIGAKQSSSIQKSCGCQLMRSKGMNSPITVGVGVGKKKEQPPGVVKMPKKDKNSQQRIRSSRNSISSIGSDKSQSQTTMKVQRFISSSMEWQPLPPKPKRRPISSSKGRK